MFRCLILVNVPEPPRGYEGEPGYLKVATYDFDPGLQIDDDVYICNWNVWDIKYNFKGVVKLKRKEIIPESSTSREGSNQELHGSFLLKIFIDVEDRDTLVDMWETIRRMEKLQGK